MKHSRLTHHLKKNRGLYVRIAPLFVLALIVAALGLQVAQPFQSVEVAFTDAAPSGLAIVPASCASSPQTPDSGSCACGPKPTSTCSSYAWVTDGGGRDGTYVCSKYTSSCPAGYTYDGSWCVVTGSACNQQKCADGSPAPNNDASQCPGNGGGGPTPPAMTISAQYPTITVGQTDDIHATFTPSSGDTLTATAINEIPPNNEPEFIAKDTGGFTSPNKTNAVSPLDFTFLPTRPGTYTFLPYVETTNYSQARTTSSSQWATVVVTGNIVCTDGSTAPNNDPTKCPNGGPVCNDGTPAPYGDPAQCSCSSGNAAVCPNGGGSTCQDGSAAPGGDATKCCPPGAVCRVCNVSVGTGGVCGVCPTGYTANGGICVFTQCPSGYTERMGTNGKPICVQTTPVCTQQYLCGSDQNLYYEDGSYTNNSCNTSLYKECSYGCTGGQCLPPPSGHIASFSVKPSLVQPGYPTIVSWSAVNVKGCNVNGTNGQSWPGTSGTQTSLGITAQTTFTLTCTGDDGGTVSSSGTVNIVPGYIEQ